MLDWSQSFEMRALNQLFGDWSSLRSYCCGILVVLLQAVISISVSSTKVSQSQRFLSRIFPRKVPKGLPMIEPMQTISERACRVIGFNPGAHTLQGTNTYLIGKTSRKILIDTGEDITSERYIAFLFDMIFPITDTESLSAILLTHGHFDHLGGVRAILRECDRRGLPKPTVHKHIASSGKYETNQFDYCNISNGEIFRADESTTLRAIYSPGHTDDHVAFVLEV
jgi:endoribonuclease LACTB2